MNKQTGFTIIELVVVIALLGILSAVALPRFISLTDDAHKASVQGTLGAFASAVMLAKAKAVVKNKASGQQIMIDDTSNKVTVNKKGFPVSTTADEIAVNATNCANIWGKMLSPAPKVTDDATATADTAQYRSSSYSSYCRYIYLPKETLKFQYNTNTGEVKLY